MHVIAFLVAVIVGLSVWYWRLKVVRQAGDELIDAVQTARGAYRRRVFRNKAEASPIASIEDPAIGAAVLLVSIAEDAAPLDDERTSELADWLASVAGVSEPAEAIAFARWASSQAIGPETVLDRLAPLFLRTLTPDQRRQLADKAAEMTAAMAVEERRRFAARITAKLLRS